MIESLNFSTNIIYFGLIIILYDYNITKKVAIIAKNINEIRNYYFIFHYNYLILLL